MIRADRVALTGALLLFLLFFANVAMGAAGMRIFLGDVAEMLVLFASCTLFVTGVLIREAKSARHHG